ncbi:MAG: NADP-dependent malic enzyme [Candidatus Nomurabacteria bacterium]|jgi:malate dehydrogenase (oxaloacetate-decarboxylating)|nr:NADP-dependent malic enzyme [Candidatus Nomurabacteria bacterium]
MDYDKLALDLHRKFGGKIALKLRDGGELTVDKLSAYYTPGVAAVCQAIADDPTKLPTYTWTNNLVAVISDGSAVLGLGDIGSRAALPVMEGKALLFKHFANIDAVPIVLDVHRPEEIIAAVKAIAPSFGAINLEDIAAPKCFEIEATLRRELPIPLMHDDQHGTAVVVLAGLINALKIVQKDLNNCRAMFSGVGAAGVAIMRLLKKFAPNLQIVAVDSRGGIFAGRDHLNNIKQKLLDEKIISGQRGDLADLIKNADIFVGVSQAGILTPAMVHSMAPDAIVFALANPTPEIMPDEALKAGARIVATGRSDFPNQVNNALAFPGIFRGALDHNVKKITNDHKIAAARAIAGLVKNPTPGKIIPSVFDAGLVNVVADVVR